MTKAILGALALCGAVCAAACGDDGSTSTGGTGASGTGGSAASTGGNGTGGNGTGGSTSSGMTYPCSPTSSCTADHECIGLADNAGKTKFGLRMSELDFTAPAVLGTGLVQTFFSSLVAPPIPSCNVSGAGTTSWLFQLDTTAGTLTTGGAKPVADPTQGYAFVDEMVAVANGSVHVQPVALSGKPDAAGHFSTSVSTSVLFMPFYTDAQGTELLLLPIHDFKIDMGTLSASQNCIGHYNAEGLDPDNSCIADDTHPTFVTGASLSGFITLEEADTVVLTQLDETLCVLLSGDAATYGDGANPVKCKRTAEVIDYQGDTCSMAGQTCKDAVHLDASFAASSVSITN